MSDESQAIKTSVVIPVYNTAPYLAACLDSVLAQTQREIEIILVDDGSTDGSPDIERAYASRDSRIHIVEQPNLRQGAARNRGLQEARGQYVYFLDSDDVIESELLETCYEVCRKNALDFVTFDTVVFRDDPAVPAPEWFPEIVDRTTTARTDVVDGVTFWLENHLLRNITWVCWLEYFSRDFLVDNDLRFVESIYFEDNDWIARVFLAADRMQYIPQLLHRYRSHSHSTVNAGFTPALAWSCFEVFETCYKLREQQQTVERSRVVEDVINGMLWRFRQFYELGSHEGLQRRLLEFARELLERAQDRSLPLINRRVCLRAFLHVESSIAAWLGDEAVTPMSRALFEEVVMPGFPTQDQARRVGLYGTGDACTLLLCGWDATGRELVFLETNPEAGKVFKGKPVYAIGDAGDLELDLIVITSEKATDAMMSCIYRCTDGTIPVYVLSRYVLALNMLDHGARLEG